VKQFNQEITAAIDRLIEELFPVLDDGQGTFHISQPTLLIFLLFQALESCVKQVQLHLAGSPSQQLRYSRKVQILCCMQTVNIFQMKGIDSYSVQILCCEE